MEKILKYLRNSIHKQEYFSEKGCALISSIQKLIVRERIIIREDKHITIPGCQIWMINDETINAFSTKIDDEYWVFINKGVVEDQKIYLESLDWGFVQNGKEEYIDDLIKYGFYFMAFHEYAHIYCGHTDARLQDNRDKRSQEYEADMFAMDYLIKYILHNTETDIWQSELEKLFIAIYFLLEKMQKQDYREFYNDKLLQNYYDPERINKRDHPLDAQRMLYLYEMINIIIVTDGIKLLPVKENILQKLISIKKLTDVNIPHREYDYRVVNESVQSLKSSLQEIRKKIPRINFESEN